MVSSFEIGHVYTHSNFAFKDGESSAKRLIVLGKSNDDGRVYLIKTTSKHKHYLDCHNGCNSERQIYLLSAGIDTNFEKDTYIQFDVPFPLLESEAILDKDFGYKGKLNEDIFNRIKSCFGTLKDEVSGKFYRAVFPNR